jgi:hypothetical protein
VIPVEVRWDGRKWRKTPKLSWELATTDRRVLEGWWRRWPDAKPGIPLKLVGWVVIDLDDYNDAAFHEAWRKPERTVYFSDRRGRRRPMLVPEHYSICKTPSGGRHIVFAQPDPPIIDRIRWSEGVEVLGIGRLLTVHDTSAILYPRVAQRCVLPEVFRQRYVVAGPDDVAGQLVVPKNIIVKSSAAERVLVVGHAGERIEVATPADALWSLDPTEWNGNWAEWFALAGACKAEGIEREDFCLWSMCDPDYADDRGDIEAAWDTARGTHPGYFHKALAQRNIHVVRQPSTTSTDVGSNSSLINSRVRPTSQKGPNSGSGPQGDFERGRPIASNWVERVKGILRELDRDQCDDTLYSYSCLYCEIIHEQRLTTPASFANAQKALEAACPKLVRERGIEAVRRTIRRAFVHVEAKIKEAKDAKQA